MISAVGDEVITLCITFLTNSEYIKNPYLKAKLVSTLFHGIWPVFHRSKGVIGDALTGSKFANDYLLHALMKFYIGKPSAASQINIFINTITEVESTGAHTQFYDKFNIRYEIFQVVKCIWTNDVYQQRLTQESKYVKKSGFLPTMLTSVQDEHSIFLKIRKSAVERCHLRIG